MSTVDPSQKSYVCIEVFNEEKPILLVSREDGDWCFLCGGEHPDDPSFYRVVGIGHLLKRDPELVALLDLAPDEEAERIEPGQTWIRRRFKDGTANATYSIEDAGRKVDDIDLKRLEKVINSPLPPQYKNFLKRNNGGRPTRKFFKIPELNGIGQVLDFYAIDDPMECCRIDWNFEVFRERMPRGFLPIACEDGGNIICLCVDNQRNGQIYYWDHNNETSPPGFQNVYRLADSLDEFLDNLFELDLSDLQ